ncbi:bacillithiol biosynthesis deacetylase BshB1 [Flavobacteriaceae bacterium]|jgi:bacillithiol biosynthesis deacetylase BshB1|nr:bacillithiol biosynthesis deacetylase BshB1 [Flavobacteriaceae bacterium]MDA9883607.1 bacillithiol biosynthesis deacetylase BshB1 [Flavobacteriaceae bacterium]
MKVDILAFGAHPDDVEMGCGGTIAKSISMGKIVGIIDLTRGELGTNGSVELRDNEAAEASSILGSKFRLNLDFEDGFVFNSKENQIEVIKMIRHYQPDIILSPTQIDRHSDHGKASDLIYDSAFLSGLSKLVTNINGVDQEPWRPRINLNYQQWNDFKPDILIDISDFIEIKKEAILAFKSQVLKDPKTKSTKINSENFIESIKYRAKNYGRLIDKEYAEAFQSRKNIAVNNIFDLL